MIVLVGESASGKSSIEKCLVEKYGAEKVISYTTRPPRSGETDGVDYHFISEEQFAELESENFFIETAVYRGWHYGTALDDCFDSAKVAVLTPHGLRQIANHPLYNVPVYAFYINVPRRDRLIKILQRGDDIEEAYRRSLSDVGQFDGIEDEVDAVLHNPGYQKSVEEMTRELLIRLVGEEGMQALEHELQEQAQNMPD